MCAAHEREPHNWDCLTLILQVCFIFITCCLMVSQNFFASLLNLYFVCLTMCVCIRSLFCIIPFFVCSCVLPQISIIYVVGSLFYEVVFLYPGCVLCFN